MTNFQATLVNAGYGQLALRDSSGKVSQKWTLSTPKCVIGSGANCSVSCQLAGIADHHVLMVIGAKQLFLRALTPGLTRNGKGFAELVITGNEPEVAFEIAGHQFRYSRQPIATPVSKEFVSEGRPATSPGPARPAFVVTPVVEPQVANVAAAITNIAQTFSTVNSNTVSQNQSDAADAIDIVASSKTTGASASFNTSAANTTLTKPSSDRLKFTFVRALEKNRDRNEGSSGSQLLDAQSSNERPAWVEAIVREALRPVESRLDDLNGPLQIIERSLRRQQAKRRRAAKNAAENAAGQPNALTSHVPALLQPVVPPELLQSQAVIEQLVSQHASRLEHVQQSVGQVIGRLADVDRRLSTGQTDRLELSQRTELSSAQVVALQHETMSLVSQIQAELQTQLAKPNSLGEEARLWQRSVEAQLAEVQASLLAIDDIKSSLLAALEQNRSIKSDLAAHQQQMGLSIADVVQSAVSDAVNTSLTGAVNNAVSSAVNGAVNRAVNDAVETAVNNAVASAVSSAVSHAVSTSVTQAVNDAVSSAVTLAVNNAVASAVNTAVSEASQAASVTLSQSVSESVSQSVSQNVCDRVCGSLREQLGEQFTNEIADRLTAQISAPLSHQLSAALATQLSESLADSVPDNMSGTLAVTVRETIEQSLAPLNGLLHECLEQSLPDRIQTTIQESVALALPAARAAYLPAAATAVTQSQPEAYEPVAAVLHVPSVEPVSLVDSVPRANDAPYQAPRVSQHPIPEFVLPAVPPADDSLSDYDQGFETPASESTGAYAAIPYSMQSYNAPPANERAVEPEPTVDEFDEPIIELDEVVDDLPHNIQQNDREQNTAISDSQPYDSAPLPAWWAEDPVQSTMDSQPVYDQPLTGEVPSTPVTRSADSEYFEPNYFQSAAEQTQLPVADNIHDSQAEAYYAPREDYPSESYTAEEFPSAEYPSEAYSASQQLPSDCDYAPSAFSEEQLELDAAQTYGPMDSQPLSGLSNPLSGLSNTDTPPASEHYASPGDSAENVDGYAPYDSQAFDAGQYQHELATVGEGLAAYDSQAYLPQGYGADSAEETPPQQMTHTVQPSEHPTVSATSAVPTADGVESNDESVEDYMRRLLARMRGVSETEVKLPSQEQPKLTAASVQAKDASAVQHFTGPSEQATPEQLSEDWTEPFDPEKYVPRGAAPEKNRDLNALREIANNSARSAIQVSARRRQGSAILIKSAVALVGLVAGVALVSINGARINIAFIATIASFLVAAIWGYDAFATLRPLLLASRAPKAKPAAKSQTPDQ